MELFDKRASAFLGGNVVKSLRPNYVKVATVFNIFISNILVSGTELVTPLQEAQCCNIRDMPFAYNIPLHKHTDDFEGQVFDSVHTFSSTDSQKKTYDSHLYILIYSETMVWLSNSKQLLYRPIETRFRYWSLRSSSEGYIPSLVAKCQHLLHLGGRGVYYAYVAPDFPMTSAVSREEKEVQMSLVYVRTNYKRLCEIRVNTHNYSKFGKMTERATYVYLNERYLDCTISTKLILILNVDLLLGACEIISESINCPRDQDDSYIKVESCLRIQMKIIQVIEYTVKSPLTKYLQKPSIDMIDAATKINKTLEYGVQLRGEFEDIKETAVALDNIWKVKASFNDKRICRICYCLFSYCGAHKKCQRIYICSNEDKSACKKDGDQHEEECSGNGFCDCGQCKCEDDFAGQLCQCDRRACYTLNSNVPCSGRGDCNCNECNCNHGFIGDMCECPVDSVCIAPGESEICSGAGECDCGECKCKEDGTSGRFCEDCPTCGTGKCQLYKDCVQWKGFTSGEIEDKRHFEQNCSHIKRNMKMVDSLDSETENGATLCTYNDAEDDCIFYFTYHFRNLGTGRDYQISIQRIRTCPEPPNLLAIVLSVVASIVAIGLLTLLVWKVVTTLHDKKEFDRFEEDRKKAEWTTGENPLYKEVTQTIQNPNYRP
ncbi:unnamed protein product [Meganyctiphanes norvegica]|uniref:Integrin beta n=1 Tax=Meganyctiphanes norvegica TaxID=48144 RepID=A0AAV2S5Y0_MEGNR